MDYIIFGIGSSATLVLTGWLLRDWGPRLRDRKPAEEEILSASDLVMRMAWSRFCATCGMAILICGMLVMLVTLGALSFAPTDDWAAIAVASAFGLAALLMLVWTGLYLRQFGARGVLRPRPPRAAPEESPGQPAAAEVAGQQSGDALPDAVGQPAPTFAETAAARGGMGRFAAFFRKEPDHESAPAAMAEDSSAPDPVETPEAHEMPADVERQVSTPTDSVIAELSGDAADPDEKKLAPTDPLVTSVRNAGDVEPPRPAEDGLVSDLLGSPSDIADAGEGSAATGDEGAERSIDTSLDRPEHEVALAQLRRRRLSRISKPSEMD